MNSPAIVWFRHDLRLADHPALAAAVKRGGAVVPVFIWAPEEEGAWPPGEASRWWLHQSLARFGEQLRKQGAELMLRRGPSAPALLNVARETGARAVYWNRRYEPVAIARDSRLKDELRAAGLEVESFNGALLHEPWEIKKKSSGPFQVFTPFWRTCLAQPEAAPLPAPAALQGLKRGRQPVSLPLSELELEPKLDWATGLQAAWRPGSEGAWGELTRFLRENVLEYDAIRNLPGRVGTSRLSPHLHFGEISPREVWQSVRRFAEGQGIPAEKWRGWQFLTELGWREFAHHLLYHFPRTPEEPLRAEFARFPWRGNEDWRQAWQRGRTGYPLVDAGMRELWGTGWMHNRVRMVVASFLVKNLLISWREGARWFWDTLVDADLASNTLGWQWTAGCGADAAPYFRIFNPVSQSEKFDAAGDYLRRWVPELARLDDVWIHRPWEAPPDALERAGIALGRDYPAPIVSHTIAREVALEAYQRMRAAG
ncbi:MAG: DNA photolyase family protein [Verrucomicrobia bacterium]|nr:DNA photolyase family protein [Verrucomicrobiota bacterium]